MLFLLLGWPIRRGKLWNGCTTIEQLFMPIMIEVRPNEH